MTPTLRKSSGFSEMVKQKPFPDSSLPVSEANRPNRLPPFRILDLMVLTSAMAFVFMVQDKMMASQPETFQSTAWLIIRMVNAIPGGIAIASIFWIANQQWVTGRFFLHPGHWILGGYAWTTMLSFGVLFFLSETYNPS